MFSLDNQPTHDILFNLPEAQRTVISIKKERQLSDSKYLRPAVNRVASSAEF